MNSKVSIIIPVYNAADFLENCLNSVVNQSYRSLEVIVINDGSTDNSVSIIKRFIESDSRFSLYDQSNQGLGHTRNRGISISQGKYLFFLDADDEIPKNAICTLVQSLEKTGADFSCGKVIRFNTKRKYVPIRHLEFNLYNKHEVTNVNKRPELLQDSIACNKLWRKDFILNNELFFKEKSYYEDLTFTTKAMVLAKRIAINKKNVYYWRVREDKNNPSITQQQMKLSNTSDRINVLINNRNWLTSSNVNSRVIREHDLKILLDVLRLHVLKYCLVKETDKKEWLIKVTTILNIIPSEIAQGLPDREKKLYDLIMNENYLDLMLFSQAFTNHEKISIVTQLKDKFILEGFKNKYDITKFLKPTIIVDRIESINKKWVLSGTLTIPKASKKVHGKIYAINRKNNNNIHLGNIICNKVTKENNIYQYENQLFSSELDIESIKKCNNFILDLYFRLNNYSNYRPARVRLNTNSNFVRIKNDLVFYKTNFGNLSIKKSKINHPKKIIRFLLKKLFRRNIFHKLWFIR
ncbi:glycosyltransferase family 2 protein [Virgibacillus proomii]|uniref:glycosyltransferase family 2 protein n=1 Tax=Virgibacillus proomii TaxID=84407 RepID=UPI001C124572|nr:glycosyltransferase family 2 protein [Virgibacillus proomii]MBU5268069.1 glycosyltransferase [Virgibacillus proomii]